MTIWIDADGCPVVSLTEKIAKSEQIPLAIVKNIHHHIASDYAKVYTVDSGADQADFFIANRLQIGDLVITQDYGLAAMAIAKKAYVINQYGQQISQDNIDFLLERRHFNQIQRKTTGKSTKFKKRQSSDDDRYAEALSQLIGQIKKESTLTVD